MCLFGSKGKKRIVYRISFLYLHLKFMGLSLIKSIENESYYPCYYKSQRNGFTFGDRCTPMIRKLYTNLT